MLFSLPLSGCRNWRRAMSELSPASQAVMDAFTGDNTIYGLHLMRPKLAAALRAAVRQVKTDENLKRHYAAVLSEMLVLDKLLAIAAELESQ